MSQQSMSSLAAVFTMYFQSAGTRVQAQPRLSCPDVVHAQAQAFRQTVVLSSFAFPEASALFAQRCSNWAGRAIVRVQHQVTEAWPGMPKIYLTHCAAKPASAVPPS